MWANSKPNRSYLGKVLKFLAFFWILGKVAEALGRLTRKDRKDENGGNGQTPPAPPPNGGGEPPPAGGPRTG